MRKVILSKFVTLDGFISGPNGELDWMPGNQTPDEEVDSHIYEMLDDIDTILLGARTYELFVDYWPGATTQQEVIAEKLNAKQKIVFSNALDDVNWGRWDNARLAKGDLADEISRLKKQSGKDMVIFGGANLAQSSMDLGLIDEWRLIVAPVVLGRGKPLFEGTKERINLNLLKTKTFKSGNVLLSYAPQR